MKSTLFLFAGLIAIALFFNSCQEESTGEGADITGTWSFTTLKGEYSELWVNENSMLIIRNPNPRPSVFDYIQKGDTIKLYIQGESAKGTPPLDQFYIQSKAEKEVTLLQDGNENKLTLIEAGAPKFENTEDFKKKVLSDFSSRAPQK